MDNSPGAAHVAVTPIVTLASEIDCINSDQAAAELALAFSPDTKVVIADLSHTTFCDSSAIRALLHTHKLAASQGIELRVVVNSQAVMRILELTGLTSTLRLYPDIAAAIPDGQHV